MAHSAKRVAAAKFERPGKKKTMVMLLEPDNSQGEIFIYREIVQGRNAKPLRLGVQAFSQEKISNRFENKTIIVQTA